MRISDREVLGMLVGRYDSSAEAAAALGLHRQFYPNWRARGVPRKWRRTLWLACRERGIHFTEEWINHPTERAALRKALRSLATTNEQEAADGEAGPTKEKRRGERPPQRRAAAGRNIPASPR
jgi:hypothetical protein